ncbi:MAG: LysR family transcriptional regulator [Faecalicoccus sp.]|nr:LysR family transcriptional regulator [Faecalicoccus sp.]
MNISYDYYRVFYYVAKYKSFTAAARILFNNQPNITRMMKKLEEELGCSLFIRNRRGVSLTPEGEKLYAHVSVAFEHITIGEQEIARDKELASGIVTIAASEIALHCVLLPVLKEYRRLYPEIRIRISNHSTPQALMTLKEGLADFAIVTEPFDLPADISREVIRSIQEVAVCTKEYEIEEGTKLSNNQIFEHSIIGLEEHTSSFAFYTEYFNSIGVTYKADIEAATADQILPMVKSDLGIGFVPTDFLNKEDMDNLVILDLEKELPKRNICILKRKNTSLSLAAYELEKMIKQKKAK